MASFGDYPIAMKTRDIIERIARNVIDRERPRYRYATVMAIDGANFKCDVKFTGQDTTVRVSMGTIQPAAVGAIVRVAGTPGDFYIEDVIGGGFIYGTVDPPPPPDPPTPPTTWTNLTPGTNVTIGAGTTYNFASARVDFGGYSAELRGELKSGGTTIALNAVMATVPVEARPTKTILLAVPQTGASTNRVATISIDSTGALKFLGNYTATAFAANQSILLDGVRYAIT